MYCVSCGQELEMTAKFCSRCGEKVAVKIEPNIAKENEPLREVETTEIQKDILAKEIVVFLKLIGISLVISIISIFVINGMNNDNLSGITNTGNVDLVIKSNQRSEVRKNAPKVFFYSLLILTLGRYVVKGITWADSRTNQKNKE